MPLSIVKGPPNSGRTEKLRRRYAEVLQQNPILILPGTDDVQGWDRRLAADSGAFLGGETMNFKSFALAALGYSSDDVRFASTIQRQLLMKAAVAAAWPTFVERTERHPGLVDALIDLVDEFRETLVDPATVTARAEELNSEYVASIAATYEKYEQLLTEGVSTARDERRRDGGIGAEDVAGPPVPVSLRDDPGLGLEAIRADLSAVRGRPVFVAGFDELTGQQLEMLRRMATDAEVTVAITHEPENPAMRLTDRLLADLLDIGGEVIEETRRDLAVSGHTPLLLEIEREFMKGGDPALEPGDSFTVMRSSGRRGEAEAVSAEIARLIAGGTPPEQIAIALQSPAASGPMFRDLLAGYGLPATLETETPVRATTVGRTILNLLKASATDSAADLIAYLRGPLGPSAHETDRLERTMLRNGITGAKRLAAIHQRELGTAPAFWDEFNDDGRRVPGIRRMADLIASERLATTRDDAALPPVSDEIRAAEAIIRACGELGGLPGHGREAGPLIELLGGDSVKTWPVTMAGSIRITSLHGLRAKRLEYVFIASLQERDPGGGKTSGPFLSPDVHRRVGLREPIDPESRELQLFHSAISVPTKGLYLSSRIADESGKAEYPSPLVAEVESLFDPDLPVRDLGRRNAEVLFEEGRAPTVDELARSVAARPARERERLLDGLELPAGSADAIRIRVERAEAVEAATRALGTIRQPELHPGLASEVFSATAIESFLSCPYRWYIERTLRPDRLGPEPEPISRGNLIHGALAGIYRERQGRLPRAEDLEEWLEAAAPAVARLADESGNDPDDAEHRVARRRAVEVIREFLRGEAGREDPRFLPWRIEASFGMAEDGPPPLEMGGWSLRGSIDRIDVSGDPEVGLGLRGIVLDYKTGGSGLLTAERIRRERKVQLQLYLHAAESLWGVTPVAGLYLPVFRSGKTARGLLEESMAEDVTDLDSVKRDRVDLRAEIDAAIELANGAVAAMRAGEIEHDPRTCPNHLNHPAVPDWVEDGEITGVDA